MHDRDMNLREGMYEMEETQSGILRTMESVPTQAYMGLAFGSIILSAFFFLIGRQSLALFVGQWPPTFAIFALVYKLLRPSHERPVEQMKETMEQAKGTAREMGSRMGSETGGSTLNP